MWMQLCPAMVKKYSPIYESVRIPYSNVFALFVFQGQGQGQATSLLKAIFQLMAAWHEPWGYKWFLFFLS